MLVKDVDIKENLKVIDPRSGYIGYYKGDYSNGVFLSASVASMKQVVPVEVSKEDFLKWKVAPDKEKATIKDLIKQLRR